VTLADEPGGEARELLAALAGIDRPILFCFPNADAGSRALIASAAAFCATRPGARLVTNLPSKEYLSLLRTAAALVGNSSSGIMEAASLGVPVVDVGARQRGRERARNVLWAPGERGAIAEAIGRAADPEFRRSLAGLENPYGDGRAAERIADALEACPLGEELLVKRAMRLERAGDGWKWSDPA